MTNEPIDPLAASLPNAGPVDLVSPRPWIQGVDFPERFHDAKFGVLGHAANESDAAHIVKCVNSHDALTAENKMLREALGLNAAILQEITKLENDFDETSKFRVDGFGLKSISETLDAANAALSKSTGEK